MTKRTEYKQFHFVYYELILPYCTVCTPAGDLTESWHTPITCEESSDSEYRLWLASSSSTVVGIQPTPSIGIQSPLNSSIFKCVTSASETTAKLKPGEGMSSRGTMSIKCSDFDGDPGPINFSEKGTFFGKLLARNVLDGKKIITHYFTLIQDASGETVYEVGTSEHFITNTQLSKGVFTISAKDALKDIEAFSKQFPSPSEIELTADIDATTTTIPVNDASELVNGSVFRIDNELIRVQSISVNTITSYARGSSLSNGDGTLIYDTRTDTHSAESTVQPCYVMSKTPLQDVLNDIFIHADLTAFTDYAQWTDEIQEWNSNAFLYGVFSEPERAADLLNELLVDYMIDMWLNQGTQKIQIAAVSAWKNSIRVLSEGNDLSSLQIKTDENTRFSRAYQYARKRYQAETDEIQNYSKLIGFTDVATETSDLYGTPKVKDFGMSNTTSSASAQILCARYVQRFARTPKKLTFTMPERKLADLGLSDIVDVISRDSQTPDGSFLQARDRAQITKIQPSLNGIGREYKVEALAYVPLIASNPGEDLVITLSGTIFDENLYARAGAPNVAINVTFVFDGCTIGSTANNIPAVRAGNFMPGTVIKIICINNTKWSAIGGDGANARTGFNTFQVNSGFADLLSTPTNGGDSYQSDGIETHIYLNYGVVDTFATDCTLYAAGGGGAAGGAVASIGDNRGTAYSNTIIAGGGGSGIPSGRGNTSTYSDFFPASVVSNDGTFDNGGVGAKISDGAVSVSVFTANTSASGDGYGGFSLDGGGVTSLVATASSSGGGITHAEDKTAPQSGGLAGGAFKGSDITVYCLAAQLSKLREGNSDSFTLVTV